MKQEIDKNLELKSVKNYSKMSQIIPKVLNRVTKIMKIFQNRSNNEITC